VKIPKLTLMIRFRPFKLVLIIGLGRGSGESPAPHGTESGVTS
jgi:hypothetical protein